MKAKRLLRLVGLLCRGYLPVGFKGMAHWSTALRWQPRVRWGSLCLVEGRVLLSTDQGGSIHLGRKVYLAEEVKIRTYGGFVELCDGVAVNYQTILLGPGRITIGQGSLLGPHVIIAAGNHGYGGEIPIQQQPYTGIGITVEEDVWICANACITDGVTLAKGTVVAAGAVVTKSTEPYSIVGGIPARVIGYRESRSSSGQAAVS
jgi:acetyltransferase-like isoleucine patch superfamily enzyme